MRNIPFKPHPNILALIEYLLATGLYGTSLEGAVERLVCEALLEKMKKGGILEGRQRG